MATTKLQHELKKKRPFESAEQEATLNLLRTSDQLQIRFTRLFRQYGSPPRSTIFSASCAETVGRCRSWKSPTARSRSCPGITGLIDRWNRPSSSAASAAIRIVAWSMWP